MAGRAPRMSRKERKEFNRLQKQIRANGLGSLSTPDLLRYALLRSKTKSRHVTTYLKKQQATMGHPHQGAAK